MKRCGWKNALSLLVLATAASAAPGTLPQMVADVAPSGADPASSDPLALTQLRPGVALFYARDAVHGYELWRTDGTAAGTALVRDINPGPGGSELAASDETLYPAWARWWMALYHIEPFPFQQFAVTADGVAYFFAHRPSTGAELWRSDGTEAGTYMVRDVWEGPRSCTYGHLRVDYQRNPQLPLLVVGDAVYFGASDASGPALWRTDGTPAGTAPVCRALGSMPPAIGQEFVGPHSLAEVGDKILFFADDGTHGLEPWAYDLQTQVAEMIADLNPIPDLDWDPPRGFGSAPDAQRPLVLDGKVYFFANPDLISTSFFPDRSDGLRLYVYDGTGVRLAAGRDEIGAFPRPYQGLVAHRGRVLFSAGTSIYEHDPSADAPNAMRRWTGVWALWPFLGPEVRGQVMFASEHGLTGYELWATDNGPEGAHLVRDLNPAYDRSEHTYGSGVAVDFSTLDYAGATLGFSSSPRPLFAHGDRCYFAGADRGFDEFVQPQRSSYVRNTHLNLELYRSDGTAGAVELVAELEPGPTGSLPRGFAPLDATRFVFTAQTAASGRELWVSDGTAAGTRMVLDVSAAGAGGAGSDPGPFAELPGRGVLFAATDPAHGREAWLALGVGTPALLGDLDPGPASSGPCYTTLVPTPAGDRVFFGARTGASGLEPFVTDGTAAGTRMVRDVNPGPGDGLGVSGRDGRVLNGAGFGAVGGKFVFPGDDGVTGREPWTSDGTEGGTRRLVDLYLGDRSSLGWSQRGRHVAATPFVSSGGLLLFSAFNPTVAQQLLRSGLHNFDGNPFYPGGGGELWATDGSRSGTRLVADLNSHGLADGGTQWGSDPRNLTVLQNAQLAQGSLVFYAHQGASWTYELLTASLGRELYVYDAGAGRASLLRDINPAPVGLEPGSGGSEVDRPMAVLSGAAYFAADDGASGIELWRTDGTPAGTAMVADLSPGPGSSDPGPFAVLPGRVVFQAADSPSGEYRLYAYAPGDPAPVLLSDHVRPVRTANDVPTVAAWDGRVYFAGYSAVDNQGIELYSTDGTPGSVRLEGDLNPGPAGSSPRNLTSTSYGLFFSATDGVRGLEPWAIRSGAPPCRADFDASGQVAVPDIFAFLASWFASEPRADFDASGSVAVPDIFAFLSAWFAGCG